jgi:uncharacterized protein YjbJ (UPF0337 family)
MTDNNSSTLQSYVDVSYNIIPACSIDTNITQSATGAVQSAIGSLTGNTTDQARGQRTYLSRYTSTTNASYLTNNLTTEKQDVAEAKNEISHAGANIGGHSVSASGVAKNDPNRSEGSWNQTIGSGKEFVGGALGLEGLKKEGQQQ